MMDAISEARLANVYPGLAAKIRTLATMLEQEGIVIRVTQGFRTWAQQHALFFQGRADLADVNACFLNCGLPKIDDAENRKVTNADAGYSWHNYGLAVDVVPAIPGQAGFQPDWNLSHPAWARIVAMGESLGLRSGIAWKDEPHFELTGKFGPKPPDEVINLYKEANEHGSGAQAVWEAAEITA